MQEVGLGHEVGLGMECVCVVTDQVSEVVACLSTHESHRVTEPRDIAVTHMHTNILSQRERERVILNQTDHQYGRQTICNSYH